jgi:hypothetical protein
VETNWRSSLALLIEGERVNMAICFRYFSARSSLDFVPINRKEGRGIWERGGMLESPGKINSSCSIASLLGELCSRTLEVYSIGV